MKTFYLSFGCGQPNAGRYFEIRAESYEAAREIAFEVFGKVWCMLYTADEWYDKNGVSQAEKYGYRRLV